MGVEILHNFSGQEPSNLWICTNTPCDTTDAVGKQIQNINSLSIKKDLNLFEE